MLAIVRGQFAHEIQKLRDHITFNESLISSLPSGPLLSYAKSQEGKFFEYRSMIVTLYGVVESSVEKMIHAYLEDLRSEIFMYQAYSPEFQNQHFRRTVSLLNTIIGEKHIQKFGHLNKEDLLKNLNSCLVDNNDYVINKDVFTVNTGNLTHSKIKEYFTGLDIEVEKKLYSLMAGKQHHSPMIFSKLDDLISRRNEIAHSLDGDILNNSEIEPFIDFIETYLSNLFLILERNLNNILLRFRVEKYSEFLQIEKLYGTKIIWIKNSILSSIISGHKFYIKRDNRIIDTKCVEIRTPDQVNFTIKLDTHVQDDDEIYFYHEAEYIKDWYVYNNHQTIY